MDKPKVIGANDWRLVHIQWKEKSLSDGLDWHRSNMGDKLSPDMEKAFTAGFRQAWGEVLGLLHLHGFIVCYEKTRHEITGRVGERRMKRL